MNNSIQTPVGRTVEKIELHQVHMPFSELARAAMDSSHNGLGMAIDAEESWDYGDFLLARLTDTEGNEGWGEVFVWLPETGVSTDEMMIAIKNHLGKYVLGADPSNTRAIRARMDRNVTRNEPAKAVLELACFELAAKQRNSPVYSLLGGRGTTGIPMGGLIPLASPTDTAELCQAYVSAGYQTLRIKLGTGVENDRSVIAAAREAVGPEVNIRVDYNQAYDAAVAIRALAAIEPFHIEAGEQPLPVGDVLGMVEVQKHTPIPLFLHEGFFTVADVVSLHALGGTKILGLNMERPGGITAALDMIDWAALQGMKSILHNQPLGVGAAAIAHVATARADRLGCAAELAGDIMFAHQLVKEPLRTIDGYMNVNDQAGWGVEVDLDALSDYSVNEPLVINTTDLARSA